jgi:glycosyltransferase involved in cell wall biosynthesis
VPNGIDVEQVQTTTPVDDGFDILFVGRLIETKNVEWLLQAFEGLAPDTTLGIIGEGPHGDALKRLAGNLGIESRVQFLGFLEAYDDVLRQMRAAAVFVTPSTREGFGITLVEALAAGCTVVAVEHPQTAASEILGDAGLLVDPSVESLQAGIQQALAGWTPREDPIERATRYDWDAITEATRELLQRTIDSD